MIGWKRPALIVGGIFFIVVCAVVIVLVSTIVGIALLGLGTLAGLLGLSAIQRRSGGTPISTSVVIGITLFLLGTVIAAVAGVSGDLVSAAVGVVLVVLGLMLVSRSGLAMRRGSPRPAQQTQPLAPPQQPSPMNAPAAPASYPPGVAFEAPPHSQSPAGPSYVPPPAPGAERFCPSCGSGNTRAAGFCRSCGNPLPPPA